MINNSNSSLKKLLPLICGLLGILIFIMLYGVGTLDVTNDGWILNGYDEPDITQRYAGWVDYKDQPWQLPLGKTQLSGYPYSINIVHMDAIPILAVFFKIFSRFLPATFQYEGIYMLLCFFLQGYASGLLLSRIFKNKNSALNGIFTVIGSLFFILAPIFIERSFRHTSLASHYLILFSMYLYLKYRQLYKNSKSKQLPWTFLILMVLSVGITPYFMPMCMIFALLTAIDYLRYNKKFVNPIVFLLANIIIVLCVGLLLGSISTSYSASRVGYGYYSMNINSLINPVSLGKYQWSMVIKSRNYIAGDIDGFNYLGFGFLLMLLATLFLKFYKFCNDDFNINPLKTWMNKNGYYLILCIFATIFAISHIATLDGITLFNLNLPECILNFCGIFRASSRMFYPVYYSMMLFSLYSLYYLFYNKKSRKLLIVTICVVLFFLLVQVLDISKTLIEKRKYMDRVTREENASYSEILWNEKLNNLDDKYKYCQFFDNDADWCYDYDYRKILIFAGKNNLRTNVVQTNTFSKATSNFYNTKNQYFLDIINGKMDKNTIYVTTELESFEQAYATIDLTSCDCEFVKLDTIYFILP